MHDDAPTASFSGGSEPNPAASAGPSLGETIGRYKLLRVLGTGGFGVVYEAEQSEPVKRRVALKVIKPGMDTAAVVSRFEAERQALAVMDHPCIAKVFDGGITDPAQGSRPYFVMELVRGVPITEHCDRNRLAVDDRIRLFIRVCEAVQHAHAKGVIHRDLKPSNVLVAYDEGADAQPKVIDFGIAKALNQQLTAQTIFTEQGQLIGTPEYMSPEQAEMSGQDIDTRADLYSMGVMLYELLTGSLPFESKSLRAAGFAEIQRIIREVEPQRPSTRLSTAREQAASVAERRRTELGRLSGTLKRDLDWVVMRCLEKDRSRRYETANALATELHRYLNSEPVLAGPPSLTYRCGKFVRRHRAGIAVVGVVLLALVATTVISTAAAMVALRERDRTRDALAQRDEALAEVTERERQLSQVAKFQADQLASIDPSLFGERVRTSLFDSLPPEQRATVLGPLAGVNFTSLATSTLEQTLFEESLEAIRARFADQPLVRAELLQTLANTMRDLGMLEGALSPQQEALEIRTRELGESDPLTLDSMSWLGVLHRERDEPEQAERFTRTSLEARRALLGDDHPDTLTSLNNYGFFLQEQGELDEAEKLIRLALEGRERTLGPDDRSTLISLSNMGIVLTRQGRTQEAEEYYRRAVEGNRRVLGPDDPITLHSINNLGLVRAQQGDLEEAGELWAEALAGYRRVFGDAHPSTLVAMHNLAKLRMVTGDFPSAEALALECERRNRERWGPGHSETRDATGLLVELYTAWNNQGGAHGTELSQWTDRLRALNEGP